MMGEVIAFPNTMTACQRCSVPLQVASSRKDASHAAAIRFAKTPKGVCRACAVTQWIRALWPLTGGPTLTLDMVRVPHVQAQIDRVLVAAGSDAEPTNWAAVVANWDLPLSVEESEAPKRSRSKRGA